jgi:hypothetical protein
MDKVAGNTVDNFETTIASDWVKNGDICWEFSLAHVVRNQECYFRTGFDALNA